MPLPWPLRRTCSAAEPPPPPCAYRCSSRVRWQGIILLHRNATPFIVGIARLVAFLDHPAYRPHTLWSGKRWMVRKRDQTGGSDEQRAAADHRRCFADPLGQTWLRAINQLKRPTRPPNSRVTAGCDARRGISNKHLPKRHLQITYCMKRGRQFKKKS